MTLHRSWYREIWIIVGIVLVSLLFGPITGHPYGNMAVGLGLYLLRVLQHLHRLHRWVLNKKRDDVPDAEGVWGDVFDEIRKLEREANRRKEKLTDTLARFQDAAAIIPDAMVVLSNRDEIQWANTAAQRLLGLFWPRDHMQRITNLVRHPDFADYLANGDFSEVLQFRSPLHPELVVALQILPFGAAEKLMVARDVSRIARLEQMRSQFVANVSHELRTPVTVLLGFIEILQGLRPNQLEDLPKHLGTMHEQALRMQRLVDDLLTLSKLETAPPPPDDESVDVAALMSGLKEQAEILSGEAHHVIELQIESNVRLRGSSEELRSAFSNLVNNAVRYTPAGGTITLRWDSDAGGAHFSVRDRGEGIAPQHIPYLTERFYRVDSGRSRATGGTGLGLSIVKHVLLRHDASLRIESRLGQGSQFICDFPLSRLLAGPARRAAASQS